MPRRTGWPARQVVVRHRTSRAAERCTPPVQPGTTHVLRPPCPEDVRTSPSSQPTDGPMRRQPEDRLPRKRADVPLTTEGAPMAHPLGATCVARYLIST